MKGMENGDVQTITIRRNSTGAYVKAIEVDWLRYLGFSDKEIDAGELKLVVKADVSDRKKLKFIGIGRPERV